MISDCRVKIGVLNLVCRGLENKFVHKKYKF